MGLAGSYLCNANYTMQASSSITYFFTTKLQSPDRNQNQSGLITLQLVQAKEQAPGVENPVLRQEFPLPQDTAVWELSADVFCVVLLWLSISKRVRENMNSTHPGEQSQGDLESKDLLWLIKLYHWEGAGHYKAGQEDETQLLSRSKSCLSIYLGLGQNYFTFSHASSIKWARKLSSLPTMLIKPKDTWAQIYTRPARVLLYWQQFSLDVVVLVEIS